MIYLDTSVALAHLLGEDRHPPATLWNESLVTSRLLEYELFVRLNARRLGRSHGQAAHELVARLALLQLSSPILARALEPFAVELRTLDAVHLASLEFLRGQGVSVSLASYDTRMLDAARALRIPLAACD
ncbi:MAG TPA: PIN domain-containing protein [Polyangiales bacterium]|nr:PIN domain-containing protein [Polyangiales bacterium]